jgi:hypothetical protein
MKHKSMREWGGTLGDGMKRTGDIIWSGQCKWQKCLENIRINDAFMLLQLSRIQCSAQLFARTFGLTMDDGEEDEQIANEGKGEETGSQNEEEKLNKGLMFWVEE